ncbi:helix-turn-helix domain-containing protein [Thalassotalea crassostreae]|nr:helix-turn-helix domain-containing protein [Thalassotalea crassostreae]
MSKHKRIFKIETAIKAEETSSIELSRKIGVSCRQIRYWGAVYRIHGSNAFQHPGLPYSKQFKLHVIKTMAEENWSLSYTSAYFDLSSSGILSAWLKRYNQSGSDNLTPKKIGRPKMAKTPNSHRGKSPESMSEEEMKEELEYLRAENAVLKKLEALAQEKRKRTKKKR